MRKTFLLLAFAFLFVANEDEIYPPLLGGSAVTIVLKPCVDDGSGSTCEFQNC